MEKKQVAWATGRHINCMSCSSEHVTLVEKIYEGDDRIYEGQRCAWCRKKMK